jgi:hypothetical protein
VGGELHAHAPVPAAAARAAVRNGRAIERSTYEEASRSGFFISKERRSMRMSPRTLCGGVVVCACCAVRATADPIPLPTFTARVSGELAAERPVRFELVSPNLSFLAGATDRGEQAGALLRPCRSCAPGESADFRAQVKSYAS